MIKVLKKSTSTVITILMVDESDHITGKTGLSAGLTIYASKAGGAPAVITPTVTELSAANVPGVYALTLTADHVNTLGDLQLHITGSGADPTDLWFTVSTMLIDDVYNELDSRIGIIWNSIKNQGELFSKLMDKVGLLEKNKGLVKQDVQDIVSKIKFPQAPEIKIPEPKDYSASLLDIRSLLSLLSSEMQATKSEVNKNAKVEQMLASLSKKVEDMTKPSSEFHNLQMALQGKIDELSACLKSDNSAVKYKADAAIGEIKKLQAIFSKFDSLMTRIQEFNAKLSQLDSNDKSLQRSKDAIQGEIQRLTILVNTLSLVDRTPNRVGGNIDLLTAFGGKR